MKYGKLLLAAAAGGAYLSAMYISPWGDEEVVMLSGAVLQLSGSMGKNVLGFSFWELMRFSMCLFPAFLFELYAGILLYRHFCTASIYVFSRYPHRVRWYLREAGYLGVMTCVFQLFLHAAALAVTDIRWDLQIDTGGMALLIYHFLIQLLWTYTMALSANLLAVYLGSSASYTVVVCMQFVCVALFYAADLAVKNSRGLSCGRFLIWNPMAHLVLAWHSSNIEEVRGILEPEYMGADLNHSLILFLMLGAIATSVGAVVVNKHELLISNSEGAV